MNLLQTYYLLSFQLTGFAGLAHLLARLVFGMVFLVHGWPKLKSLKTTAQNFDAMGFKPGNFWGTLVALVEFFGGLAVLFGFFTSLAALLLAINMTVATLWKIGRGQGFSGGYEFDLLLLVTSLFLATLGAGYYSLDYYWVFR